MFPIWDDQVKWWYTPVFTWVIIAINIIVFVYQLSLSPTWLEEFFVTYAVQPGEIIHGQSLITLITSMFMHGWRAHIIGNMVFLKTFGDNIEARMGNIKFLIFYFVTWIIASLAHILTDTASMIPSLWASWAISWVLWAYLIMFPWSRVKILDMRTMSTLFVRASQFLVYWIWFQLLTWFGSLAAAWEGGWVAYFAHIWWFAAWWIRGTITKGKYTKWHLVSDQELLQRDSWNPNRMSALEKELQQYLKK